MLISETGKNTNKLLNVQYTKKEKKTTKPKQQISFFSNRNNRLTDHKWIVAGIMSKITERLYNY